MSICHYIDPAAVIPGLECVEVLKVEGDRAFIKRGGSGTLAVVDLKELLADRKVANLALVTALADRMARIGKELRSALERASGENETDPVPF